MSRLAEEEVDKDNNQIFDDPFARLTATEVGRPLETLQNLSLFNEGNKMQDILKQFESLCILHLMNSRNQASSMTFLKRK